MLDTVNFTYRGFVHLHDVGSKLKEPVYGSIGKGNDKKTKWVKGALGNTKEDSLNVYADNKKISITGSTAKHIYSGCNIKGLPMQLFIELIESLSNYFDYNFIQAEVNRVDIGTSLELSLMPFCYRDLLFTMPNFYKSETKNSTYFMNETRTKKLLFYGKGLGKKLLKYEFALMKSRTIQQALKLNNKPTVADIINNYNLLLELYKNAYFEVQKSQIVQMNSIPKGKKDITNYLWAYAANKPELRQSIESWIKQNPKRNRRYEMNAELRNAANYDFNETNDLIKELDIKVIEVCESYKI